MVRVCMYCNLPLQGSKEIIEGAFACKECADNYKANDPNYND